METMNSNQTVAANVRRIRKQRGWTQTHLASELSRRDTKIWTVSMVSDAECAADSAEHSPRDRQFNANEINALARSLQVSILELFIPQPEDHVTIGQSTYSRDEYVDLVVQFPPTAMPPGMADSLRTQYLARHEGSDRIRWARPQSSVDVAEALEVAADALRRAERTTNTKGN